MPILFVAHLHTYTGRIQRILRARVSHHLICNEAHRSASVETSCK